MIIELSKLNELVKDVQLAVIKQNGLSILYIDNPLNKKTY